MTLRDYYNYIISWRKNQQMGDLIVNLKITLIFSKKL